MQVAQAHWTETEGWRPETLNGVDDPQLVLLFGGRGVLGRGQRLQDIRDAYPSASLLGCSTAGEICGVQVADDSLVATAVRFEHTRIQLEHARLSGREDSRATGERLARMLEGDGLAHVFVLSDGLNVNGSQLVQGLADRLPPEVTVTGGLSGDGDRFQETLVVTGEACDRDLVTALGLYGDRIRVGYGSLGGWDSFGPERMITRADGNVLYELDGKSALKLYKEYLGEHAQGLPATGLLFPLALRIGDDDTPVVRTILGVDEADQSMTFAGDLPLGAYARLMKANFDRLVDGAAGAARTSHSALGSMTPDLAILISCVGRKMVLKQRVEEEVEAVRDVLGEQSTLTGFYSYGEISPFRPNARCELHNQTMTITALSES